MRKAHHTGHEPDPEKGWYHIADIDQWFVFVRPGNNGWYNVKVVLNGRKRGKANYSFGWSIVEHRVSDVADTRVINKILLDKVIKEVVRWIGWTECWR